MTDKTLTPGEALWLLNNLPTQPPHGVMPTAWRNHRRKITLKLQRITKWPGEAIDAASREADYYRLMKGTPQ